MKHPIIQDGDRVLIDPAAGGLVHPDRKSFYLANACDSSEETAITLKRVAVVKDRVILAPANPACDRRELEIDGRAITDIILGRAVWVGREHT